MAEELRIYKPKGQKEGMALKFQYRKKPKQDGQYPIPMLFLEIAKQTGVDENKNARFDWRNPKDPNSGEKSITMKLGLPDVAELLLVLTGKKEFVGPPPRTGQKVPMGLFHKNKSGNTVLKFQKNSGTFPGYFMQVSTGKEHQFKISLTDGEAILLKIALEGFVQGYFGWMSRQ